MPIPIEIRHLTDRFFNDHSSAYDFETVEGCGQYMEALIPYAQSHGFPEVGFLKYTGSGTKYNNHRIDSFLYKKPAENGKLQSCDVIANAETDHASAGWSPDIPRYNESDWVEDLEDLTGSAPMPNTVPWVGYNEQGFERLKKMLKHDYERRPQGPDYDVSVWAGRYFHNQYMGPNKIPLGENEALRRVKGELCIALGIPNDGYLGE